MRRRATAAARVRRSVAALTLALALALALAGCSPEVTTPPTPTVVAVLPDGVTVELRQSRADVAGRQASVRVTNGSDEEITIGAVTVSDPRFQEPARRLVDRASTIGPGRAVDVRVQLAEAACDVADDADATVTLQFAVDEGEGEVELAIDDTVPFVDALHARECVRQRVLGAASIDLGAFTASPAREPAALDLSIVARAGATDLRLIGIRETNLLTFAEIGEAGVFALDIDLATAERTLLTVPLPLQPARCDPHAVLEDKRGTVFRLLVEIDGEEGSFDLAASDELRGRLLDWVADWCDFGVG